MSLLRACVIPADGFGDALIMMVASERLRREGYETVTYQKYLHELADWFPGHIFRELPPLDDLGDELSRFDLVILQNDNTPKARAVIELYRKGVIRRLSTFYYEYHYSKHGALSPHDILLDPTKPLVDNVAVGISLVLNLRDYSKNNGIQIPKEISFDRQSKIVLFHALASHKDKCWPLERFMEVARHVKSLGFSPLFLLSASEAATYQPLIEPHFPIHISRSLKELAELLPKAAAFVGNGSGPSHLASLLHLPSVVLIGFKESFRLWHPGWLRARVLMPPRWIPNWKGMRWQERYWQRFISSRKVFKNLSPLLTSTT